MNFSRKALSVLFGTLALCLLSPIAGHAAEGRKHALLIGIDEYNVKGFSPLSGCLNDVRLVRDLLTQERFGFVSDDITVLTDAEATHSGILEAIDALAEKSGQDDIVYIHYSGHGSTAPDENGDEAEEGKLDSTFVSYGARSGAESSGEGDGAGRGAQGSKDDYDILDDELNASLARLTAITHNVVFVADSCHSGTITRGENTATRGGPADTRSHPAAGVTPVGTGAIGSWVAVGAAQVEEKAVEYKPGDGSGMSYGAFTWFWVRALQAGTREDTWLTVFDRAKAMMRDAQIPQTPSLEGSPPNLRMNIFGGMVDEIPKRYTVTHADPTVRINVGTFAGVSEKSEFQAERDGKLTDTRLTVQKAEAFDCEAEVKGGPVKVGDIVVLTKWQPSFPTIKVAFRADFPSDEPLLSKLRKLFDDNKLAAYEFADSSQNSHMLLLVTRPKKDQNGNAVMVPDSALPEISQTADPEVWVLDPSQAYFYNKQENLKTDLSEKGLEVLAGNLGRLARLYGLRNMRLPEGGGEGLVLEYKLYVPVSDDEWATLSDDVRTNLTRAPSGYPLKWKLSRIVPANDATVDRRHEESLLVVRADNRSDLDYYIYGINATPNAEIVPFLPDTQAPLSTKVEPGQARDFGSVLILTEEDEYVRVMAALNPFNVHNLKQSAVEAYIKREKIRSGNPIEAMLLQRLYPTTRGDSPFIGVPPAELASVGTNFLSGAE